jgi:coenzyme F420 hydrogenase subunit beta
MTLRVDRLSQPIQAGGGTALYNEVFAGNRCTVCGACVGLCPYMVHRRGRVIMRDRCTLNAGRCYDFCPMGGARGRFDGELGRYKNILIAQATSLDILKRAQYGGVVSTLTSLSLSQGLVDEAILTGGHPENAPAGIRVKSRPEVLAAAGSRFAASGAVGMLNEALKDHGHSLAFVGTPCQVKAVAAMRRAAPDRVDYHPKRIKIVIGLFCSWALDYRRLSKYLRFMLLGERSTGYDIPPPPAGVFKVYTGDGIKALPLDDIRGFRLNACRFCDDMTGAQADISVGGVEGLEAWNTVIVRTAAGQKLLDLALDKKLLVADRLPDSDLEHLVEAAGLKKERSRRVWREEG